MVLGIQACGPESEFSSDDDPPEGFEPYFQHQARLVPYFLERKDWSAAERTRGLYVDPETARIKKEDYWDLYRGVKILLTVATNRNARTQIVAAVDELGMFPEDHFYCLGISARTTFEDVARRVLSKIADRKLLPWISAIMNSAIGQAWVAMSASPRGMTVDALKSLPLPGKFDSRIPDLVEATRLVERPEHFDEPTLWSQWSNRKPSLPGADFATIAGQLNNLVFRSYGLSRDDFVQVTRYLESMTNPWVNADDDAHVVKHSERRIRGTVISVDTGAQQITLKLSRYSKDPLTIPIPHDFPGWALESESEFTCLAPRNNRDPRSVMVDPWLLRDFRPLPYAYLSATQLEEMVLQKLPEE